MMAATSNPADEKPGHSPPRRRRRFHRNFPAGAFRRGPGVTPHRKRTRGCSITSSGFAPGARMQFVQNRSSRSGGDGPGEQAGTDDSAGQIPPRYISISRHGSEIDAPSAQPPRRAFRRTVASQGCSERRSPVTHQVVPPSPVMRCGSPCSSRPRQEHSQPEGGAMPALLRGFQVPESRRSTSTRKQSPRRQPTAPAREPPGR